MPLIVTQRVTMITQRVIILCFAQACKGKALDLVLLFLRSKNNNKHGFPKENNQGLCPCMQGLLKSKILNALDCNPLLRRSISYHGFLLENNQALLKSSILTACMGKKGKACYLKKKSSYIKL